jgi:hypothetical protein
MNRSLGRGSLALSAALAGALAHGEARLAVAQPSARPELVAVAVVTPPTPPPVVTSRPGERMMFTTYFYTAGEAVIQGYEDGTNVRVFALATRQPIYAGTLDEGETVLVPTGAGVFGFVSDKKASILVGTPSSCAVVGYWARDEDGSFVSDRLLLQLPSSSSNEDDRVVVWAAEESRVTVRDLTSNEVLFDGSLPRHGRFMIPRERLGNRGSHVLDVRSSRRSVSAQVYYDEGFTVPSTTGRTSGQDFLTYIGRTTEGENDLILTSYGAEAHVSVEDIDTHAILFDGTVAAGAVQVLTMHQKYLRIHADRNISAAVAPYQHYVGPYAEHHFAGGAEGTGIDTDFIVTSPHDLWIFSYFNDNAITVDNMTNGERVFEGTIAAGGSRGIEPGHGLYRIRSTRGTSVMGGANSCGGEYSPAGRLFAVDEAVMRAVEQVYVQRREAAAARGETMSPSAAAAAPLSSSELRSVTDHVRRSTVIYL